MKTGRTTFRLDTEAIKGFRKELLDLVRGVETARNHEEARHAIDAVDAYGARFRRFVDDGLWPHVRGLTLDQPEVRVRFQKALDGFVSTLWRVPKLREHEEAFDWFRGERGGWAERMKRAARAMWTTPPAGHIDHVPATAATSAA